MGQRCFISSRFKLEPYAAVNFIVCSFSLFSVSIFNVIMGGIGTFVLEGSDRYALFKKQIHRGLPHYDVLIVAFPPALVTSLANFTASLLVLKAISTGN